MEKNRKKARTGIYGDRSAQVNAKVSDRAKEGLRQMAEQQGVSLNEWLERLGRGQISQSILSGESWAN